MIEIRGSNVEEPYGELDEVIGKDCVCVHLERMDESAWCLIFDDRDGRQVIVNLGHSEEGRGFAFIFEDSKTPSTRDATK